MKNMGSKEHDDEIWVNKFNEESAQDFREQIRDKSKGDPMKPILVYIDSYGGQVDSLAKMIETMDETPNPIVTVAVGKAMSCGAVLLSHGDIRFCGPHSRIMIHEVSGGVQHGDVHDMYADSIEVKRLNRWFMGLLARNCGIKGGYDNIRKIIKNQDGRDRYLDAQEAVKFGIVDGVGMPMINKINVYQVEVAPPKRKLPRAKPKATKPVKSDPKRKRK